jgi:hypothetical protein
VGVDALLENVVHSVLSMGWVRREREFEEDLGG